MPKAVEWHLWKFQFGSWIEWLYASFFSNLAVELLIKFRYMNLWDGYNDSELKYDISVNIFFAFFACLSDYLHITSKMKFYDRSVVYVWLVFHDYKCIHSMCCKLCQKQKKGQQKTIMPLHSSNVWDNFLCYIIAEMNGKDTAIFPSISTNKFSGKI